MAMTLVTSSSQWSASGTGWRGFAELLKALKQPTGEMRETNDGDLIRRATLRRWASAIEKNIDRIREKRIPDQSFLGGYRYRKTLDPKDRPLRASERKWLLSFVRFVREMGDAHGARQF